MSTVPSKIFIQVETPKEQEENMKNSRKTLKTIQKTGTDKENLVGRLPAYIAKEHLIKPIHETPYILNEELKHKKVTEVASTSSQTSPLQKIITEKDLTSDEVSETYWEVLAEKRRMALEETLEENEYLCEKVDSLESELNQSKQLLQETRELVEVLTEMLQEKENVENERVEAEAVADISDDISEAEEALPESDDEELEETNIAETYENEEQESPSTSQSAHEVITKPTNTDE